MQAIQTTYKGPTDSRGARILAKADAGSATVAWDHALGILENHLAAAMALVAKLGWDGLWIEGSVGDGYVFVRLPDRTSAGPDGEPGDE
jgi:hypothetical protein